MNDHDNDETQNADEPSKPDIKHTEETLILKKDEARPHLLSSGEDHIVAFADGGFAQLTEVMTLLRDPADGRLVVHINGYAYRSLGHHPAIKKQFTALMKELSSIIMQPAPPRPVTDLPENLQNIAPKQDTPKQADTPDNKDAGMDGDTLILHSSDREKAKEAQSKQEIDETSDETETSGIQEPELDDLLMMPDLEDLIIDPNATEILEAPSPPDEEFIPPEDRPDLPPPPPDGLPGDLPDFKSYAEPTSEKKGFFGRRRVEYNAVPELNIAGAIEAFLQHKLDRLPEWQKYGLHVHPAKDGTLRIEANGKFYQAVSDIEDEKVRNFLSETISEWQERQ